MTRINTILPSMLTDQHLVAEYRELPRVFSLGRHLDPKEVVTDYKMGKGHVKFFYDKLLYLSKRHEKIVIECLERGFKIKHTGLLVPAPGLDNDWVPTSKDHNINLYRLITRVSTKPEGFYRYKGRPVLSDFYNKHLQY